MKQHGIKAGGKGLYLALILDLYSHQVVGWGMQPQMQAGLVTGVLRMSGSQRPGYQPNAVRAKLVCDTAEGYRIMSALRDTEFRGNVIMAELNQGWHNCHARYVIQNILIDT